MCSWLPRKEVRQLFKTNSLKLWAQINYKMLQLTRLTSLKVRYVYFLEDWEIRQKSNDFYLGKWNFATFSVVAVGFCRGNTVTEKVQLGPCWVANRNAGCRISSSYFSFQGQTLYKGGFESIVLTRFSSACSKEFFNVSWSGTFEREFATQNCPRGAAGESNSGKISGITQKASREYYKDT